jgi:hypothetical protein
LTQIDQPQITQIGADFKMGNAGGNDLMTVERTMRTGSKDGGESTAAARSAA